MGSIRYAAAEQRNMKKVSGNHASKPPIFEPGLFADELSESQQLRARLLAIADELQETVTMLEKNLLSARLSVRPQRRRKERSVRKNKESILADELENREDSYTGNNGEEIVRPRPGRTKKGARRTTTSTRTIPAAKRHLLAPRF
jgi:hypothetical protein